MSMNVNAISSAMTNDEIPALNTQMSAAEQAKINMQVETYNKSLIVDGKQTSTSLGKDDFLKLLVVQLSNQDPTNPMEDTEFISQMATFSSLEQMQNMNKTVEQMSTLLNSYSAMNTLGRTVELNMGDSTTTGHVDAISSGVEPQIMVNGNFYSMKQIQAIYE